MWDRLPQLQAHGLYEQYLAKTSQANDPNELVVTGLMSFMPIRQINLIATNEFHDVLDDLPNRSQPLDLAHEQSLDETIQEVLSWKSRGHVDTSPNLPIALRKYRKQFDRLVVEDNILYRLFFDDCGKIKHKQYCVPKSLWREVVYRLHHSRTAGHLGIVKTIEEFRKRFYFPNFTEFFLSTIRNCLQCLQETCSYETNQNTFATGFVFAILSW